MLGAAATLAWLRMNISPTIIESKSGDHDGNGAQRIERSFVIVGFDSTMFPSLPNSTK